MTAEDCPNASSHHLMQSCGSCSYTRPTSGPHIANRNGGRFSCTCGFTDPAYCPHEAPRTAAIIRRHWPLWLWEVTVYNPWPGINSESINGWALRRSTAERDAARVADTGRNADRWIGPPPAAWELGLLSDMNPGAWWTCEYCSEGTRGPFDFHKLIELCFDPERDEAGLSHAWRPMPPPDPKARS